MPCISLINSSILSSPIIPGDVELGNGRDNERGCPYTNFYDYGYNCFFYTATELSAIPNGATISKIAFEMEAPSNGTFEVNNQEVWIAQHDTGTEFPLNMRVNGTSATDTTWNANFINYTKIYNNATLGFTKVSGDPNIVWRDLLSPSSFTWTANKPICIFWLNGDGAYQSGTSSYPRAKGDNLSGLPPRYYALDEQDNTPFLETSFTQIDLTFRPNIKIFYT